jgi:hypothetical protein
MRFVAFGFCAMAALALSACGDLGEVKNAAGDVAKGAMEAAGGIVDTQTACTMAGQSEEFCGCLQTELGAKIEPQHIEALGKVIREGMGGDLQKAAENAPDIDPKTRQAIGKCLVTGATEAAKAEAGQ